MYPVNALNKGIEGEVRLLAYIDTAGTVRKCEVVNGNEYLNDAAVSALKEQRFRPYIVNGEKRPVQVVIPIVFTISTDLDIREYERAYVMEKANAYLGRSPDPVSNYRCGRSPGDLHSYYSEGLFWWPQEGDPRAPYTYIDEKRNPDSFREHAGALAELGKIVPALTAAYSISGEVKYAEVAAEHLRAWFIDEKTRMKPHLHMRERSRTVHPDGTPVFTRDCISWRSFGVCRYWKIFSVKTR
ncbi:MAG: TonB family protein [Candidatus Marinimicrobia bacterium]|nr:TonB family protein [Candidatus Neomarinimicrobiota bacterium]